MNFLCHCVFTYKSVPLILKEFFSLHSYNFLRFSFSHSFASLPLFFLRSKRNYLHWHAHSQRAPRRRTRNENSFISRPCNAFPLLLSCFFFGVENFSGSLSYWICNGISFLSMEMHAAIIRRCFRRGFEEKIGSSYVAVGINNPVKRLSVDESHFVSHW